MCTSSFSHAITGSLLGGLFGGANGALGGAMSSLLLAPAVQPAATEAAQSTTTEPKAEASTTPKPMVSPEEVAKRREALSGRVMSRNPLRLTIGGTDATGVNVPQ